MQLRAAALAVCLVLATGIAAADPAPTPKAPVPPVPAPGPAPAMTTGLWEWSILQKTNSSTPTPERIAKLPPDLQARIKAGIERAKQPHTLEACLTDNSLHHGFTLQHDNIRACTEKVLTSSAARFEEHVECRGKADVMTSHITMSVVDHHTISGELELERAIPKFGIDDTATAHITGRWESADCGYTKP